MILIVIITVIGVTTITVIPNAQSKSLVPDWISIKIQDKYIIKLYHGIEIPEIIYKKIFYF